MEEIESIASKITAIAVTTVIVEKAKTATRGLPKGRRYTDDRAPTLEEIKTSTLNTRNNFKFRG